MTPKISAKQLAGMFDSTDLRVDITREDIKKLCEDAKKYGFKSVAVTHWPIPLCKEYLEGSDVEIVTGVSYPLGTNTLEEKLFETKHTAGIGATEIDYVINVSELKAKNYDYVKKEMDEINNLCQKLDVLCKVIIETFYLTDEEIVKICEIAREVKPDFIKTSTGQIKGGGATTEHVRLIDKTLEGSGVETKAAGGIRTLDDALKMIEAGATRLGTSSAAKIIEEYQERFSSKL